MLLLLGILSVPGEVRLRDCVRSTLTAWTSASSPDHKSSSGLAHRFVLGGLQAPREEMRRLASEGAANDDDLVILPNMRDGSREQLAAKVVSWLQWAATDGAAPRATFIGKADMDSLVVWERARVHLLALEAEALAGGPVYVGYMEWASYRLGQGFCGCCGSGERHGQLLQTDRKAHFGACRRSALLQAASSAPAAETHGPFPFGQGGFYAMSAAIASWMYPPPRGEPRDVVRHAKGWRTAAEDLTVGYLISRMHANVTMLHLRPHSAYVYDWNSEFAPSKAQFEMRRLGSCSRQSRRIVWLGNLTAGDMTTGTLSDPELPEVVPPTAIALHRVKTCAQRRRAWALASHWTDELRDWGGRECAFSSVARRHVRWQKETNVLNALS